jgi:hypothetical protein
MTNDRHQHPPPAASGDSLPTALVATALAAHLDATVENGPMNPRKCFYIPPTGFVEGHGYVPSVVVEGEPGHTPLMGNGTCAAPYYWGMTFEAACEEAQRQNARLGISPSDAIEIVLSSQAASR